jgi:flagellar basal-body rod modification protein FlgD
MDSSIINAVAAQVSPAIQTATKAPGALGKEDFLKLLVTQMQKQDPLNPQDPSEFTAQLAQFSSLEQLTNINQNLSGLGSLTSLDEQLLAANSIGKRATIDGSTVSVSGGVATSVGYTLAAGSQSTTMNILDANGSVVAQVDLGAQASGSHTAAWNGLDKQGRPVPDGAYRFSIDAKDAAGGSISVQSGTTGIISGVTFANGRTMLVIDGKSYTMDQISLLEQAA